MAVSVSCRQEYLPPAIKNNPHLLVIEGMLTSAPDSTVITLKYNRNIGDTSAPVPELNASVIIESSDGTRFPMAEDGNGRYSALLSPDSSKVYRLSVSTTAGHQYLSDDVHFKISPPIDSLGWKQDSTSVSLLLNTHDPSNNTRYYRWAYEETWKTRTYYLTNFNYIPYEVVARPRDSLIYFCYTTRNSGDIQLGTTDRLSQDILSGHIFHVLNKSSEKLWLGYDILLKQYAMSREEFDFWNELKKNTEETGSVFDAQPSQSAGNIHCVSDQSEKVLGYFSASSIARKRLFIDGEWVSYRTYIPYFLPCSDTSSVTLIISPTDIGKINEYLLKPGHLYTFWYEYGGYHIAENFCIDCREHGGTNIKPEFWP